jgi:hypothetical protein
MGSAGANRSAGATGWLCYRGGVGGRASTGTISFVGLRGMVGSPGEKPLGGQRWSNGTKRGGDRWAGVEYLLDGRPDPRAAAAVLGNKMSPKGAEIRDATESAGWDFCWADSRGRTARPTIRTLTEEGAPPKKLKGRKIRNSTKPV